MTVDQMSAMSGDACGDAKAIDVPSRRSAGVVLDQFAGGGVVWNVAAGLGRNAVIFCRRIEQRPLREQTGGWRRIWVGQTMWEHKPPPLWFLRIWKRLYFAKFSVAAFLSGGRYSRFVILPEWCKRAIEHGEHERATRFATQLLEIAQTFPNDWNYGNAIHHGHLVLGRVALAVGDLETARSDLLAAGRTPGSPQLNSFGPNMRLAKDVLASSRGLCRRD